MGQGRASRIKTFQPIATTPPPLTTDRAMLDSLFILDPTGRVIIEKHWKSLISRRVVDEFWSLVKRSPTTEDVAPAIASQAHYLMHIQRNDLFFLAIVTTEVPPLSVLEFLHRMVQTLVDYFGGVSEALIKENFVIVYELLEEMIDYGTPHVTELNILKDLIPPPSLLSSVMNAVSIGTTSGTKIPTGTLSNVPWRSANIKYANNEIFFDVFEDVDCSTDRNGNLVTADIRGEIQAQCKLSGMPDLILTFMNPRVFEDAMTSFHPCVRYARFERDRVLSFIPPDGTFKLMEYTTTISNSSALPLYIKPYLQISKASGKLDISIQPRSAAGKVIEGVSTLVTLPKHVSSARLTTSQGTATFDVVKKTIRWNIGRISSDLANVGIPMLNGMLTVEPTDEVTPEMHTVFVDFKVNMHTASGLKIDALQVHHEGYKPYKGVRMVTRSGRYQIRI
ncbi:hypothetical protein SeMB42_g03451 [Synchytrium endobioticum]|uniref:MHD domain-containing protein n=1 Tax=Synchytrium endobioticum TaxID=286115 RepID=A0A507D6Y9_9FUNG|nr:hypothetical protein SeLEV6574_g06537 [Synchytrium endobioticum]TPX47087.1 hypothetical protein SeMB42_g03451 [Synchytrium endobioticum]